MTTKPASPMVRVKGTIVDWASKRSQPTERNPEGGTFTEVKIQEAGKQYPITIRDFQGLLTDTRKGQAITLDITERSGTWKGQAVTYRNAARLVKEQETVTNTAGEEPFPVPSAAISTEPTLPPAATVPAEAPRRPTAPKPAPASQTRENGWREAWSQSREAQEAREAGIARAVALQEAGKLVADLLVYLPADASQEDRMAFIESMWPRLAHRAMATLKELGG